MSAPESLAQAEQLVRNAQAFFDEEDFEKSYEEASRAAESLRREDLKSESATRSLADALAIMIVSLKAMHKPKDAKNLGKECLLHMRQLGSQEGEGVILCALAEIYLKNMGSQGREKAAKQAAEATEIFRRSSDRGMLAKSLVLQAKVSAANIDKNYARSEWRFDEASSAVELCQEALRISNGIGDKAGAASASSLIAHLRVFGELDGDWFEPAQASLDIHRELKREADQARELYIIAYLYSMKEDWPEVLRYAKESMAMWKDLKPSSRGGYISMCLNLIYKAHTASSDIDLAVNSIKETLSWFSENEDKAGQAACHDLMVDMYLAEEDHAEAIASAERGLELVRVLGDKRWESGILQGLAHAHAATENPQGKDKAINAMKQSLAVFQKVKDPKGEGKLLESLCHLYMAKEKYKEALQAAQKMRTCFRRVRDEAQEGEALMTIYQVHVRRRRPGQAIKIAQEAFKLFEKTGEDIRLAKALVMSASAYMMDEKHSNALEVATKGLKLSRSLGDRRGEDYALSVIQQIEKAQRGGDEAVESRQDEKVASSAEAGSAAIAAPEAPTLSLLDPDMIVDKVVAVAKNVVAIDSDDLYVDLPLMDVGMDSLSAVAFRNTLMSEFAGLTLPASVMFDYPNVRLLAEEIFDRSKSVPIRLK